MPQTRREPLLLIVTGGRGAGKTSFCEALVHAAQSTGWQTAGVLTRAIFEDSRRIALEAVHVSTGASRTLATRSEADPTQGTRHWHFEPATLSWGNEIFACRTPCDLLVVDEAGPLEWEQKSGWQSSLIALDRQNYAIALVVIRPDFLPQALMRWPDAHIIEIETPQESAEKARQVALALFSMPPVRKRD